MVRFGGFGLALSMARRSASPRSSHPLGFRYGARRFMHNPMFPERAKPPLEAVASQTKPKVDEEESKEFLARHGGKMAFAAFLGVVGFIYSFIHSGTLKTEEENRIASLAPIEPYEVIEFRDQNFISNKTFEDIVTASVKAFPAREASYGEFKAFVQSFLGFKSVKSAHLFDRLVLSHLEALRKAGSATKSLNLSGTVSAGGQWREVESEGSDSGSVGSVGSERSVTVDSALPLSFLLVALHMAVGERAEARLQGLFHLARLYDGLDKEEVALSSDQRGGGGGVHGTGNDGGAEGGAGAGQVAMEVSEGETVTVSTKSAKLVVSELNSTWQVRSIPASISINIHYIYIYTCICTNQHALYLYLYLYFYLCDCLSLSFSISFFSQIPAEKMTVETGVKYPFKTYRKKEPQDMVSYSIV